MFLKQPILLLFFFLTCLFLTSSFGKSKLNSHCITIEFENVRNKSGRIQVQFYKDNTSFKAEKPWTFRYVSKADMKDGKFTFKIYNIPSGTYGLALLDDENRNTKMDYSWLVPTEGFGFSNYYHTAWSKPNFDDFKFNLNAHKTVTMKVRYL